MSSWAEAIVGGVCGGYRLTASGVAICCPASEDYKSRANVRQFLGKVDLVYGERVACREIWIVEQRVGWLRAACTVTRALLGGGSRRCDSRKSNFDYLRYGSER